MTDEEIEHGGRFGRCKICAWRHAKEFNRRAKQGWNGAQLEEWARTKGLIFNRKTWYNHRDRHTQHPADALVAYAERSAQVAIADVTTDDALNAIKNIGLANIREDPSSINASHTLKAIEIMERKREASTGAQLLDVIVKSMLGQRVEHLVVIDGDSQEMAQ